ncbi:hypothetical protein GGC47_004379 [Bosea sp. OAE752]|uniref:UPF0235 protein IED13_10185 n=1 Tax=Bosea spartocytisi TaxID=2773451 RepID=A0A927E9Y0_9HYPH|nr:DUF167 family protein [Bosea spartocytisi]MBD3846065.1 DUF167 domain-containing protein [Bosea spartocytisi]MCT4473249.1 DUF167 family protein [Bosea spartocytisi]
MSKAASPFWRETPSGVQVSVRLTPRGGRDALDGVETLADGRAVLKARVRAAPSEGEANAALVALVAKEFGLPRSQVTIAAGATARLKTVALQGDPAVLAARLRARFAAA